MAETNIQKIIKPTKGRLILSVIFLILSFIPYARSNAFGCSAKIIGIPFPFYNSGLVGVECSMYPGPAYSWISLIINIAIWYLVSCAILYAYNKIKK